MILNNYMKSDEKSSLLIIGILLALSALINTSLNFNLETSVESNFDTEKMKISTVSEKIHINGNSGWVVAKSGGIVTGNGTYSEPYVIADFVIDAGGSGSSILIQNSNVYFKIENCTVYNSGSGFYDGGIMLQSVSKGLIINNNASNLNSYGLSQGIVMSSSDNNTVSGNTANNNEGGISLFSSNNNNISGNTVNYNSQYGIALSTSNNNNVSGTTAYNNSNGILLAQSHFNTVSGNIVNNNTNGISLYFNSNNYVSGNVANYNSEYGIFSSSSNYTTLLGNLMKDCGVRIYGFEIEELNSHTIDTTNLVNGKPLYYYTKEVNLGPYNFTNAGQVILVNVEDSVISNLNISDSSFGISLFYSNNNSISGNTANNNLFGISLYYSNNNNISENTANYNSEHGIILIWSDFNAISRNTANYNSKSGVYLSSSNYNIVSGNTLIGNSECFSEETSQGNEFSDNSGCISSQGIPGYNLFFLLTILSVLAIIISKKLKKT